MGVIFIANVGNRDVQLPGRDDLPSGGARELGETILGNWAAYAADIQLPILGKALEWVARVHGQVDEVVLVASDQEDAQFRRGDTAPLAEVIRRILTRSELWAKRIPSGNVSIERVVGNPADYDVMMRFYERLMQTLARESTGKVYLAVSGGTPAMAAMLLLKGAMIFGERAHPLYVTPAHAMPLSLDIGRQLILDATLNDLQRSLAVNQYHAALELLDSRAELLRSAWRTYPAIHAVASYARHRLNFDFESAQEAIFGAERGLPDNLARQVLELADEISNRSEVWLLREVLHTAEISFRNGAYADFLGRAFRLSEGLSDFAVEQWADETPFDSGRKEISPAWLDKHPEAREFLEKKDVDLRRGVTRKTLLVLAEYLAGKDDTRRRVVKRLNRIGELGSYRNQMPFAHGYAGVSLASLKRRYNASRDDEILHDLKWLFKTVTGQPLAPDPYDAINRLILELIQASA